MKLAIFGGTGFIGYDFVRSIIDKPGIDFTVFSSGAKNLSNISRHDVDIHLVSPGQLEQHDLDNDTDFIINFAHPFGIRDELNSKGQISAFVNFVERQKKNIPGLRLIHLSSMSVYEPFSHAHEFSEEADLSPPLSDSYAIDKVYAETSFTELPDSKSWQLHLRPTIVYGPYGRPWTDRIFMAFMSGDVSYVDLSGHIQPVYVGDITRFINQSLREFRPGILNICGDEVIDWRTFLEYFSGIVKNGRLLHDPNAHASEFDASTGVWTFYKQNTKELIRNIVKDPVFDRMAVPLAKRLPRKAVVWIRDVLVGSPSSKNAEEPVISFFASPFFREDRLVSMEKFSSYFKGFRFSSMKENRRVLESYFEYRFTKKDFD